MYSRRKRTWIPKMYLVSKMAILKVSYVKLKHRVSNSDLTNIFGHFCWIDSTFFKQTRTCRWAFGPPLCPYIHCYLWWPCGCWRWNSSMMYITAMLTMRRCGLSRIEGCKSPKNSSLGMIGAEIGCKSPSYPGNKITYPPPHVVTFESICQLSLFGGYVSSFRGWLVGRLVEFEQRKWTHWRATFFNLSSGNSM